MRVTRGVACLVLCALTFAAGLCTAACEASNRERGGELYWQEMRRLQQEQEIPHLLDTLARAEMAQLSIESAFGDSQTADG